MHGRRHQGTQLAECYSDDPSGSSNQDPFEQEEPCHHGFAGADCTSQGDFRDAGLDGEVHGCGRADGGKDEQDSGEHTYQNAEIAGDSEPQIL
nr:hypothetical protein [Arthrobacter woluwensis]